MITLKQLEEEIRLLAYELYEKSGRLDGHDLEHWLQAERMVMSKYFKGESDSADKTVSGETAEEKPRQKRVRGSSSGRRRKTRAAGTEKE
ncbi:MAG: DUF2934 domain-containing protein [Candidatus Saccharicenans sp.]|nr:DUF2934 domain-containing protein [Candidatus Saccharicenans sp.]